MATTYLSRTFAQAGNRRTFTISYWVKMGYVSTTADGAIFDAAADGSNSDDLYIHTGRLNFSGYYGSTQYIVRTSAKYRDLSGWYHHVIRFDTTQATASDRLRLYVNGELQTALDNNTYPSQNFETTYMNTAREHTIGSLAYGKPNLPFNGSMSHFHFCDGYSYGADTFGETDATTGIWKPITAPSVTYGTNGFFLKFENSGAFGTDSSGNANNFTVNGTMTQTIDTPSNVFATLNPLSGTGIGSYTNGNNRVVGVSGNWTTAPSTLAVSSGKYYCEAKAQHTSLMVGILDIDQMVTNNFQGTKSNGWGYEVTGTLWNNGNPTTSWGATYTTGDIIGIAMDLDNNKLYFSKNGVWQNSADPSAGTGGISITADKTYYFAMSPVDSTSSVIETNFGNGYFGTTAVSSAENPDDGIGIFEYDVPTGYRALCTKSINAEEYD